MKKLNEHAKLLDFSSIEKVRLGGNDLYIEHSGLENIIGWGSTVVVGIITSPIWIPTLTGYGLYSVGKWGYDKIKGRKGSKDEKSGNCSGY